jgi:hypothetical protein
MKIKSACVVLFAILMQFTFANGGLGYSLLPTIKSIENESSCLLYAVNNEVHRMCFPSMKSERVCFIPDKIRPKMMSEIRAGAGNLLWHAGNKLYTYDKKEIHTIELKKLVLHTFAWVNLYIVVNVSSVL